MARQTSVCPNKSEMQGEASARNMKGIMRRMR